MAHRIVEKEVTSRPLVAARPAAQVRAEPAQPSVAPHRSAVAGAKSAVAPVAEPPPSGVAGARSAALVAVAPRVVPHSGAPDRVPPRGASTPPPAELRRVAARRNVELRGARVSVVLPQRVVAHPVGALIRQRVVALPLGARRRQRVVVPPLGVRLQQRVVVPLLVAPADRVGRVRPRPPLRRRPRSRSVRRRPHRC